MRFWLSKNCGSSLRDQLTTQLMLGIMSEELKPGEKLPSVREMARRCHIHANTVSAAYRDLQVRGWVEFRKGSGVYVRNLRDSQGEGEYTPLDDLIERFLTDTRAQGFSTDEVRARIAPWLKMAPVRQIVLLEPEPELGEILLYELRERLSLPVTSVMPDGNFVIPQLPGVAVVALVSRAHQLRAVLPPGTPYLLLRLRSVPEYLQGQQRPEPDALVAVASASPEILRRAHTVLLAAALDPATLEFRDAREEGWQSGLHLFQFVIADAVTAPKISPPCTTRVIRVLSDTSIEELQRFCSL